MDKKTIQMFDQMVHNIIANENKKLFSGGLKDKNGYTVYIPLKDIVKELNSFTKKVKKRMEKKNVT